MKIFAALGIALVLNTFAVPAFAQQSAAACSNRTSVCAEFEAAEELTSTAEGKFNVRVTHSEEALRVTKIDLWMQMGRHGHGSSPLAITQFDEENFTVTKAFFVMKGLRQIRVHYQSGNLTETLILPVNILK